MRPFNELKGAESLSYENWLRDSLESCVCRLKGPPVLIGSARQRLVRKARAFIRKIKALALEEDYPKGEPIRQVFKESLDPNRKAKARARNRGFKREPMPSPNGKDRGAFIVERPKRLRK